MELDRMDKISVVVPVYKVEEYLEKCIQSLLNQTYKNVEIILVDDGSPDNCPEMCDEFARQFDNIHVIHQDNGGLSAARNAGIEWALHNSDNAWFSFVDSDDWVHPQYLELVWECAKKYNSSVVCCKSIDVTDRNQLDVKIEQGEFEQRNVFDVYTDSSYDPNAVCGPLYAKELWQELRFPVGKLHEDRFMAYKLLFLQEKVAVVNHPLYYYFMNPEGIVHSEWTYRKLDDLQATEEQLDYFQKNGFDEAWRYTSREYIQLLIWAMKNLKKYYPKDYITNHTLRKKLQNQLRKNAKELGYSFYSDVNIYKYAWPIPTKVWRRIQSVLRLK